MTGIPGGAEVATIDLIYTRPSLRSAWFGRFAEPFELKKISYALAISFI